MSLDNRLNEIIQAERRAMRLLEAVEAAANLQHGGGGGTPGGMEARVARLESDMEHVKKGVDKLHAGMSDVNKTAGELKTSAGVIDERTKHFPTRTELLVTAAIMVAIIGGIVALMVRFLPAAA